MVTTYVGCKECYLLLFFNNWITQLLQKPLNIYSVSIAELLTSNPLDFNRESSEQPTFFFRLQPTLLAYCSLRNSEYNQERNVGYLSIFLHLKSSGLDISDLAYVCFFLYFCMFPSSK